MSSHSALSVLSAVEQLIGRYLGQKYVAGLWKDSLTTDLVWYDTIPEPKEPYKQHWIATTWSWASIISNRRLDFLPAGHNLAEVIEAVAKPSGKNAYGEIEDAYLRLQAKAASIFIQKIDPQDQCGVAFQNKDGALYQLDQTTCSLLDLNGYFLKSDMDPLEAKVLFITEQTRPALPYDLSGFESCAPRDRKSPKEAQACLIIAKDRTDEDRWKRAGLMIFAEYETFQANADASSAQVCSMRAFTCMKRKKLCIGAMQQLFDEGVEAQRALRKVLDESSTEELTLW